MEDEEEEKNLLKLEKVNYIRENQVSSRLIKDKKQVIYI